MNTDVTKMSHDEIVAYYNQALAYYPTSTVITRELLAEYCLNAYIKTGMYEWMRLHNFWSAR